MFKPYEEKKRPKIDGLVKLLITLLYYRPTASA